MADETKSSGLGWAFLIGGGLALATFAFMKKNSREIQVTHKECMNGNCIEIFGEGIDQCELDGDCPMQFIDITHKACDNGICTEVFGLGPDTCYMNSDCVVHNIHKECIDGFCQWVDGAGINQCINVFQACTHKRCVEEQNGHFCREVQGDGVDQCGVIGNFC